jgi:hypothetical protein
MSILKVDTLQNSVGENLVFGNKNLLINGQMAIWQRNTQVTSMTTSGYKTADRWRIGAAGGTAIGTWTLDRSTDVPSAQGFGYSFKMDCTTANASPSASSNTTLQQRIEGQDLIRLLKGTANAKKLTLSFWVKSNKTGTYIVELYDIDNTRHICKSYTISSASTWEKKELTFDGDTSGIFDNDNAESLRVNWWIASGSDYTSGTLATSWASTVDANRAVGQVNLADSTSNEFFLTGCQLEVGSKATSFEFEPYATTLSKCQRYYYRVTETGIPTFLRSDGNTARDAIYPFPTTMRANPTVTSTPNFGTFTVPYPSFRQLWGRVAYTNDTTPIFLDDPVEFDSEL